MRLTVLFSEIESVTMYPGRDYLKSLSGDPALALRSVMGITGAVKPHLVDEYHER